MRVVSIDPGSSYLKIFDGNDAHRVPAVVLELTDKLRPYCNSPLVTQEEGREYAVGHDALALMSAQPTTTNDNRDLHGSQSQFVEICNALDVADVKNGSYDLLVRSVPYDRAKGDNGIEERLSSQKTFEWSRGGEERRVQFSRVAIVPQGVGAQEMYNRKNQTLPPTMCIIDLGSYTLDVVTTQLNRGTGQYMYHPASGSRRGAGISINWFKEELQKKIHNRGVKQPFGYHELMELVEDAQVSGEYRVFDSGDYIDFEADVVDLRRELTEKVRTSLRTEILDEAMWARVHAFVLTGGGAELLDLDAWDDKRVPEKMDIFANVIGQWHAGQALASDTAAA